MNLWIYSLWFWQGSLTQPAMEECALADILSETLEDLDDDEFGLPAVDKTPTLEEILATEDNNCLDEDIDERLTALIKADEGKASNDSVGSSWEVSLT